MRLDGGGIINVIMRPSQQAELSTRLSASVSRTTRKQKSAGKKRKLVKS